MNPCSTLLLALRHTPLRSALPAMIALVLVCQVRVAAQGCVPTEAGLSGWWSGDLDGRDLIGSATGTFRGDAGIAAGLASFAFSFDGSPDHLDLGRPASVDRSGDLTVEMWVRLDRVTGPAMFLWSDFDPTGNRSQGSLSAGAVAGGLGYYHSHTDDTGLSFGYTASPVLLAENWHHVAFARDDGAKTVTIYVDGAPYSSASYPGKTISPASATGDLTLGRAGSYDGDYADGLVDEVGVYSRALTAAEIAGIFSAGSAGKCKPVQDIPCVGSPPAELWFPFDEGSGPTATDVSGSGHVGTLVGATGHGPGMVGGSLDLTSAAGGVVVNPVDGLIYDDWQAQTIEFWVNWNGDRGILTPNRQYIWDMQDDPFIGASSPFAVVVIDEPDHPSGGGLKAVGRPGVFGESQAVAPLPTIGRWEHYACVFDKLDQRISVFKNGLPSGVVAWIPFGSSALHSARIGNLITTGYAYEFSGLLDEFAIYNRALSPSEIQGIFIAGSAGKCKSPPTANAGLDQAIHAGQTVFLDGTASFDDDTASLNLLYAWELAARPPGSTAFLLAPDTSAPSFFADLPGTYAARLIVTDSAQLASDPDEVVISSTNVAPAAAAGQDQGGFVGSSVFLDGTASADPEHDPLTYSWSFAAVPSGSLAALSGAETAAPGFVPDLPGLYVVRLVVRDPFAESLPDEVHVTVSYGAGYAENRILDALVYVTGLPETAVTTKGNRKALTNFLSQAIVAIQANDLETAREKLNQAISRTDGCALRGTPDGNGSGRDWITACGEQSVVYFLLDQALTAITP